MHEDALHDAASLPNNSYLSSSSIQDDPATISNTWFVHQVQFGARRDVVKPDGSTWETAIYKTATTNPVEVDHAGIVGDEHTGVKIEYDRAICCHSLQHYRFWSAYYRRVIPVGTFGENLTLTSVMDEDLCIGDVFQIGSVRAQITQPRVPCYKQAVRLGEPDFIKQIERTGRRGFLLRILTPGILRRGDHFQLIDRPCPDAPLPFVNRKWFDKTDTDSAAWLCGLEPLAQDGRIHFSAFSAVVR